MSKRADTEERLAAALRAIPALDRLREAAGGMPVYLVGGAVRDILLEFDPSELELDLVVEGNAGALAAALGGVEHAGGRFGTAIAEVEGTRVDLAGARRETYGEPGALPDVSPTTLDEDLARRDFTVNAMAVPIAGEARLIDPHGGAADLAERRLRVLHPGSFVDDPTRALRAARYAARLGLQLEPETERLLRATELSTVSADRVAGELARIVDEPAPRRALELAAEWGLIDLDDGAGERIEQVTALLGRPPWSGVAERRAVLLAALETPPARLAELAATRPQRPSDAVELARPLSAVELALARVAGAEWLDRYVEEWRDTGLEIDGDDLIAAGVTEGPAVGRGLEAALRARLDDGIADRERQLDVALAAAADS
ncbi:MAG: hypothetical protein QOG09_1777 [Solirubrobacterales bacterium]|nr:hypothetical protein [Solirubrobacterales bacterium]